MEQSGINDKRAGVSLLAGILISLILSMNYVIPQLKVKELQEEPLSKLLARLSQWLGGYGIVWSCLAFGFAILFYCTRTYYKKHQYKPEPLLCFISVVFGFLNVAGLCMYHLDKLPMSVGMQWTVVCSVVAFGWAFLFYLVAFWVLEGFSQIEKSARQGSPVLQEPKGRGLHFLLWKMDNHIFLTSFLIICLCWLPWVVIYYPASMDNDVFAQLCMYLGYWKQTNHHPWFANCVIGTFYEIGRGLGNENLGIFLFVMIRDVLIALVFARCIRLLQKSNVPKMLYVIALLFYAVTPVWGAYAKHAFKDTFCVGLFCMYTLSLIVLIKNIIKGKARAKHYLEYGLLALFVSLFRNNCIYCIVPVTVLLFVFCVMKRVKWYQVGIVALCILMYFGYNTYIFEYGGIGKGRGVEALAIPLQQTARTVKYHGEELTKEEKATLKKIFKLKKLGKVYDPVLSDPVKNNVRNGVGEYAKDYIKIWAEMFGKYPVTYLEAACAQSYGYYAFTPKLPEGAGNKNSGMTIFNWLSGRGSGNFDFHYNSDFNAARSTMNKWPLLWEQIPVLNLTNTIAFYTWLVVLLLYYFFRKKNFVAMIPVMTPFIMILTCMASPVNDCFRYYAPVAATLPALLMLLGRETDVQEELKVQEE